MKWKIGSQTFWSQDLFITLENDRGGQRAFIYFNYIYNTQKLKQKKVFIHLKMTILNP